MSEKGEILKYGRFAQEHIGSPGKETLRWFLDEIENGHHIVPPPVPKTKLQAFAMKMTLERYAYFSIAFTSLLSLGSALDEGKTWAIPIVSLGGFFWFWQGVKSWNKK